MAPERDLIAAVDALEPVYWSGTTFRNTSGGRAPLSAVGARMQGGRWNPRDSFPALYFALSLETWYAEFLRPAFRQANGPSSLPRDIHTVQVTGVRIVDLRSDENLAAVGLAREGIPDQTKLCKEIGDAIHFLKSDGLLAPSATGEGDILVLLEDIVPLARLHVLRTEPMDSPEI